MRPLSRHAFLTSTAAIALLALGSQAVAQSPQGATVTSGAATVTRQGSTTVITQETNRGVIDWRSFSIGSGETVRFDQPGRASVTLNRVIGADISRIDGRMTANGQVWLSNPNGVMIGPTGQIDVAGLLATTGRVDAGEFLRSGQARIDQIAKDASIVNMGKVTVSLGGYAALAGALLRNEGVIAAQAGTVALAAGEAVAIDFAGDKLLRFQVSQPLSQAPAGADALISGGGQILAEGGSVRLTARAAKGVIDNVINLNGKVVASDVRIDGGVVTLGDGGITQTSAVIDARSETGVGGQVAILGEKVGLMNGAAIDASGALGGGTVLIGGDWRGAGEGRNARATYVDPGAAIRADALTLGDGGKVVVWSDDTTRFGGLISAQGGLAGGSGGKVETSGRLTLIVDPAASVTTAARAAGATAGGWLLDPTDIKISKTGSASLAMMDGALRFASGGSSEIAAATISAGLAKGDVTIQTSANGPGVGNITFASGMIAYDGKQARTLKLLADREIRMDKDAVIALSGAAHSVTLNAWANATKQSEMLGGVLVDGKISTTSGGISMVAGKDGALMASSGGASGHGVYIASNAVVRSESGEIKMAGWYNPLGGNDGLKVRGLVETKSGAIRLIGDGGDKSIGVYFLAGAVRSDSGEITVRSNNFAFGGGVVENKSGVIRVESLNASDAIDVFGGSKRTAAKLNVSADQVAKLSGKVVIGRADQSGEITVKSGSILSKDLTLQTGSGAINFLGAVDGARAGDQSLTIETASGKISFGGSVGASTALGSLTQRGAGTAAISGLMATKGAQTYEASVTLASAASFATDKADLKFLGSVDAAKIGGSTLNAKLGGGAITLASGAGANTALSSLQIEGPASLGGVIRTNGGPQKFGDVTLIGDTTLATNGGDLTVLGAVDGPATLTLRTDGGSAAFIRAIGKTTPVARLLQEGGGDVFVADSVRSTGEQRFEGAVKLQRSTVFSSSDSDISFRNGVNAVSTAVPTDLTFAAGAGSVRVDGAIGAALPVGKVTKSGSGTMFLSGGVTSTGEQSYAGGIQLTGDAAFKIAAKPTAVAAEQSRAERGFREGAGADAGSDEVISFGGAINGAYGLTVSASGVVFGGAVGASAPLQFLTLNASGSALILPSISANLVSLTIGAGGVVTQTGGITTNGLELIGPFASFNLTDANNAIAVLAANGASVAVTNGPLTNLIIGSVGSTTGVFANGAITLSQLPPNKLTIDAPITSSGAVSLNSAEISGSGLISGGSLSVSAERGSINVASSTPFAFLGSAISVTGGLSPSAPTLPKVTPPVVATETPKTETPVAEPPKTVPTTTIVTETVQSVSTPPLETKAASLPSTPDLVDSVSVATQVVAVVKSVKESVKATESLVTLEIDPISTQATASNSKETETATTTSVDQPAVHSTAKASLLDNGEEKEAALTASTIARFMPRTASFVPETGAKIAAAPTREVDPADAGGKGGQVVSSTPEPRAAAAEKETLIPGLLNRKTSSSTHQRFKEDILDLLMPEINDDNFLQ